MPTKCGSCLSTSLEYSEDGSALCRACGRVTRPSWDVIASTRWEGTDQFVTVGLLTPGGAPLGAASLPSAAVVKRGWVRLTTKVTVPSTPATIIEASFDTLRHRATISVNGQPESWARVWRGPNSVEVPIPGTSSRTVSFQFRGLLKPKITIRVDGNVLLRA